MKRKPGRRFISNIKECLINSEVYNVYYNRPVRDDLVFVESRNGKDFAGNILRLAVRIRELYGDRYTICTAAVPDRMDHIRQLLSSCGLEDVQIYEYDSRKHIQMLETAGYLINDTTFPFRYVKPVSAAGILLAAITVLLRFLSGVHWFTDILGGILISASLLFLFAYFFYNSISD